MMLTSTSSNDKPEAVDSPYFSIDEFISSSQKFPKSSFSILHINIRSSNKNFEKSREYLSIVKSDFSVVALKEMWCNKGQAAQFLFIKLGIMVREEEIWQYMSITVLILKYQKNKALTAMI